MAGSYNVEETALITSWDQENVQNCSIGLIYCSNSYCILCMAQSINDKVCLLHISYVNTPAPFTSACEVCNEIMAAINTIKQQL